jgi:hypothetical protein
MTFNVWGSNLWPERSEPLTSVILTTLPDIILLQEVSAEILSIISSVLPNYRRINGSDDCEPGWTEESNIFWNTDLFRLQEYGFESLGIEEYPKRGLFWVRLSVNNNPDLTIMCSTAHLPWVGSKTEIATGINQRIVSSKVVCRHLRKIMRDEELCIFGGIYP